MVYIYEIMKSYNQDSNLKVGNWAFEERKLSDDEGNNEFDLFVFDREKHEMNPIYRFKRIGIIKNMTARELIDTLVAKGKEEGMEWLKEQGVRIPEK